jgi:glycerate kinase
MKITIATDSFKGSADSLAVASAIEKGIHRVDSSVICDKFPVADGGEGLLETIRQPGDELIPVRACGPLFEEREAFYVRRGMTAVIETAVISGLPLVPQDRMNPLETTTFGTGELIRHALEHGCTELIIGIGGSATNDGGIGMAAALGARFLDSSGNEVPAAGKGLAGIRSIDMTGFCPLVRKASIRVACDVDNPLYGTTGASAVYGPQKGATPEMIAELDDGLRNLAERTGKETLALEPGSGAAGGLGFALRAFCGAKLESGITLVLKAIGIERSLTTSDLVITGEGRIDGQSSRGKVPVGVSKLAKQFGLPVIAFAGDIGPETENLYQLGIDAIVSTTNAAMALSYAMAHSLELTEDAAFRTWHLVQTVQQSVQKYRA